MNSGFRWTEGRIAVAETLLKSDRALRTREVRRQSNHRFSDSTLQWVLRGMTEAGMVERIGQPHFYRYLISKKGEQAFNSFEGEAIAS